ncbi:MAG: GntR family transcriptional regulator [Oscillospiraceae bacterium]
MNDLAWQFTSDRPIFTQISDQIISGIMNGSYKMGEKLPSVREFALMAEVNPNTVQRALSSLETLGLVETQRNTGKFVTTNEGCIESARALRGHGLARDFLSNMRSIGYTRVQTIDILEDADKEEETIHE